MLLFDTPPVTTIAPLLLAVCVLCSTALRPKEQAANSSIALLVLPLASCRLAALEAERRRQEEERHRQTELRRQRQEELRRLEVRALCTELQIDSCCHLKHFVATAHKTPWQSCLQLR